MSSEPPRRLSDDEIRKLLQAFEGPESPRPRASKRQAGVRRVLLVGTAATLAVVAGVAVWLLSGGSEPREAALARPAACSELRFQGRRYVARRLSPGLVAAAGSLKSSAVVLCGQTRVRGARVVRLAGIEPAVALARAGAPELVYVAAGSRCLGVRVEADLSSCLQR